MSGGEVILLTYAELAERLNIKPASAKKTVQRKRWRRDKGNDSLVRVHVPVDALPAPVAHDVTPDSPQDKLAAQAEAVAVLNERVKGLEGQLEAERRRADAADARRNDLEKERDAWRAQAQRSLWSKLFGGRG